MQTSAKRKYENNLLSSALLSTVLDQTVDDRRLVVLDMGLATSATVNFFNQSKCRLQFAALIDAQLERYNCQDCSHDDRVRLFTEALNLPANIKIDIFLFWDLFCYLSTPAIQALMEVLAPHVHSKSRAHSIGLLNARQDMFYCEYGINSPSQLWQQPNTATQPTIYAHTRRDFDHLFSYLTVDKSCLLSGNRVENLLMVNA
jgi:hypothetical protein